MTYIRYWLDGGPRISSIEVRENGSWVYSNEDPTDESIINIPVLTGQPAINISVSTSGSPEPLQLALDGKSMPVYNDFELRWFWDSDYFVQCGYIDYADIRDGSTLTLTCGNLHREWVFDVADKEAS